MCQDGSAEFISASLNALRLNERSPQGAERPLYSLASLGFTSRGTPLYQMLRMNLGGEEGIS